MLDGEIIDTIEPVKRRPTPEEIHEHLRVMHELSKVISEQWNDKSVSAVEAVREQRRDLTPDERASPDEQHGP